MTTTSLLYAQTTSWNVITITLASLATSSSLIAGRNGSIIDNTSNKYDDILIRGQVMTGTSPTGGVIAVYLYTPIGLASSSWTYPQAGTTMITESDTAITFAAEQKTGGAVVLASSPAANTTNNEPYSFGFSVNAILGYTPEKCGIFVVHSTGANLNSTVGNHWFQWQGVQHSAA